MGICEHCGKASLDIHICDDCGLDCCPDCYDSDEDLCIKCIGERRPLPYRWDEEKGIAGEWVKVLAEAEERWEKIIAKAEEGKERWEKVLA